MRQIPSKLIVCAAALLLLQIAASTVTAQRPKASPTPTTREDALFEAISNTDLPAVLKLIAAGADVNARNENDESVLVRAASDGMGPDGKKILQAVIDAGADLKTDGAEALDKAAEDSDSGLLGLLLKAGVDVKSRDSEGRTAMFSASAENVNFLIDLGLSVNDRDNSQRTPLIGIINTERAKALIDAGADVNAADKDGETPMHWAAGLCDEELITLYLTAGANINAKNRRGKTPLSHAVDNQRTNPGSTYQASAVKLLRSKGAVDPREPVKPAPPRRK